MSSRDYSSESPSVDCKPQDRIEVPRWVTEIPLFIACLVISTLAWVGLLVSIISGVRSSGMLFNMYAASFLGMFAVLFIYAVGFLLVYVFIRITSVTHIRGNSIKVGSDQFPELYSRVCDISGRLGMKKVPEIYLMQAGGALNALAVKFIFSNMVVLYSDLLEACGDNEDARDMIIAHELTHIKAGHLWFRLYLLPSAIIPFLHPALSRAREYTCDRFGAAVARTVEGALLGLTVLAAGGGFARSVNMKAFAAQKKNLNTGLMTLGEWASSHPTLVRRIAAIEPSLKEGLPSSVWGVLRAAGIIVLALALSIGSIVFFAYAAGGSGNRMGDLNAFLDGNYSYEDDEYPEDWWDGSDSSWEVPETAEKDLKNGFMVLSKFLNDRRKAGHNLPADFDELVDLWYEKRGDEEFPMDPYDGDYIGYIVKDNGTYVLWSCGPDSEGGTEDDIEFEGP